MSAKSTNWEVLLIYFLLLIPWPPSQVVKMVCSKDNSRLVRKIIRSKWTPLLDKHQVKLPLECPLHPLRDLYSPRQDAKKRDRPTQWTCRLCGKSFYQEKFLDLHFETRHNSVINEAEDATCMADFCDVLRCEVFQTEQSKSLKFGDHIVTEIEVWGESLRQSSALARANAAYLSLMPSRSSKSKVEKRQEQHSQTSRAKIVPPETETTPATILIEPNDRQSKKKQTRQHTGKDTSNDDANPKQNKSNKDGNTDSKKESKNLPNVADSENATSHDVPENKSDSENSTNANKVRANCKAEELSKLKVKCEFLVRSCIGSLLLSMSDQSFKEMEDEMNKAVCWYLTCDRYWEDGPLEPRAFPWGLILILVFVLSTGICFCYYIIWILFDSDETTINTAGINHHHTFMPQHQQQHQYYQAYEYLGGPPTQAQQPVLPTEGISMSQYPYYQQQHQQQQLSQTQVNDLYHEPQRYDYTRHSPRRYIGDQRQPASAPVLGTGHSSMTTSASATAGVSGVGLAQAHQTHQPHQHQISTNLAYQQDILDRREYASRPIATTVLGSSSSGLGPSSSATNLNATVVGSSTSVGGIGKPHYNTHPRPLASQHRHVGASQQSLRGSSSSHEIIQNEIGQNEHYIYVTYPPDLKKRYFEK